MAEQDEPIVSIDEMTEIDKRIAAAGKPEYDPKVVDVNYDDDDREFGEPDQGVSDDEGEQLADPFRVAMFFTAAGSAEDVWDAVIEFAESRGLFFEWGASSPMPIEDVIEGSPLHQAITGRRPR